MYLHWPGPTRRISHASFLATSSVFTRATAIHALYCTHSCIATPSQLQSSSPSHLNLPYKLASPPATALTLRTSKALTVSDSFADTTQRAIFVKDHPPALLFDSGLRDPGSFASQNFPSASDPLPANEKHQASTTPIRSTTIRMTSLSPSSTFRHQLTQLSQSSDIL